VFDLFTPGRRFNRRDVLRVGALGGLTLADLFRQQALADANPTRPKSVIMIWLRGGASHIDSFDMKPDAPAEIRGEFKPIKTNVSGIDFCEHLPKLAGIADKLAVIRGIKSVDIGDHTPHFILTGFAERGKRPAFGCVVSKLKPAAGGLPPYVSLMYDPPGLYDNEGPTYLGPAHRPFAPRKEGLNNLTLCKGVTPDHFADRRRLLAAFDDMNRELDSSGTLTGMDEHGRRAAEMVLSGKAREAFDLKRETDATRERYGKYSENMLMARRLVEAGVPVVTLKVGDWDTHEKNFIDHKAQLPQLDQGVHALVSDLHDRGLEKDVAVVVWGEFGRAPRVSRGDGRDHWPDAGAAVIAGGGFKVGQVIGETDGHGGQSKGTPYTPSNVLATLYRHLGLDPATTLPDHTRRPMYLLDDREGVKELG
jgi:hypothetical protein